MGILCVADLRFVVKKWRPLEKTIRDLGPKSLYSYDVKAIRDFVKSIDGFYRTPKSTVQPSTIFWPSSTTNLERTDKAIYTFCLNREWLIRILGIPIILPYKLET